MVRGVLSISLSLVLATSTASQLNPTKPRTHDIKSAETVTRCGFSPLPSAPCGDECAFHDTAANLCLPSCGHACLSDDDCGAWPASPCSACQKGFCQGDADFGGECPQERPWTPGQPQAPILPSGWNASFVMYNYTDLAQPASNGRMWYDFRFGALRQDFEAPCPFVELQTQFDGDDDPNNGPCSILFYKNDNYYIYPEAATCCKYHFPVWSPQSYRVSNASLAGTVTIDGEPTDFWTFQYSCPWIRNETSTMFPLLPAYTVQRDIYLRQGTNIPARMNETLTSGWSDFSHVQLGDQAESVFLQPIQAAGMVCHEKGSAEFLQVCKAYNARGRLTAFGYA